MNIFKSPVFYFGFILLVTVALALAAPFIVNWNGYRDNLESWGHKLTGRQVAINGPISVRLFPWPRLIAEDVSLANPPGYSETAMITTKSLNVELALAGLFSGEIRVERIIFDQPVIAIERNALGQGNWQFTPDEKLMGSNLLDKVKLDEITLNNGTISLTDNAHKIATDLSAVNVVLSATAVEGPWRVRGSAQRGDVPLDITFSSNAWKVDAPLKFSFRLSPQDGELPAFSFEGQQLADLWSGKVRLDPVVTEDGKQSLEGQVKPLQMQADVKARFNSVAFDNIHIVPADTKDSTTLIEGSASVDFSNGMKAAVNLQAPRVDLDRLTGAESVRVWRAGGMMAPLNSLMAGFSDQLDLQMKLDVTSLTAASETLENVKLSASMGRNAIRIPNLSASLPGHSQMKFDGVVFPGANAAELGGSLGLESNDARALVGWLWPEGKANIAQFWKGARGRLKAQSDVTWSGKRFGLHNLNYELDGDPGKADIAVILGSLPSLDVRLDAKTLDVDNYLGSGIPSVTSAASLSQSLASSDGFEKRFDVKAASLRMNGVEARDVALALDSNLSGFELKALDIASVEGAHVKGSGLVLNGPDGPSGDVKLAVLADQPQGFLTLIGALPKGVAPAWANVLGKTDMQADISVKPGDKMPLVNLNVSGVSGPLQFSATGNLKGMAATTNVGLSTEISSANGADLVRMFGGSGRLNDLGAGKISLTTQGSLADGFQTALSAEMLGAKLGFDGSVNLSDQGRQIGGQVLLTGDDAAKLAPILGIGPTALLTGKIDLKAALKTIDGKFALTDLAGSVGLQKISGSANLASDGSINADLSLQEIALKDVLALTFLPWDGTALRLDKSFSAPVKNNAHSEIWLRPDVLKSGVGSDLSEAVIGIAYDAGGDDFSVVARDKVGEPFKLDLSVKPKEANFALSGSAHAAIDLAPIATLQNGNATITGSTLLDGVFSGTGRSPLAMLAAMAGKGTYSVSNGALTQISPADFFTKIADIKDTGQLRKAFDDLLQGSGMAFAGRDLNIAIVNGTATLQPIAVVDANFVSEISTIIDLPARQLKTEIKLTSKSQGDLPPMRISYEGEPGALVRRSDLAAISSKLGFALIAKDMAELDRVKKVQEKLAADEAAQQQADADRFAAYQAQRNEMRLRLRELRVHAAQRMIDAAYRKVDLERLMIEAQAITKLEYPRLLRDLRVHTTQRLMDAANKKVNMERLMIEAQAITRLEMPRLLRKAGLY